GYMHYHKQIYFMSIDERTGDIIALCVLKDISDFQRKEAELKRNHGVISVLSQEYTTIFYIDMNDEMVIPYRMSAAIEKAFYSCDPGEYKYSDIIKSYIDNAVVEEERESLFEAVSLDNIRERLKENNIYRILYRSDVYGFMSIYEMKFAEIGHGDKMDAIVVGISNKDEEFRKKSEQQSRMTQNYDIINVLASEYAFVLYIDLNTDEFMTYNMNRNAARILREYLDAGMTYSEIRLIYVNRWIIEEDREKMYEASEVNNLKKQLTDRKSIAVTFRGLNDDNEIHYYEMKAIRVGNEGVPSAIVLGIADRDSEIRRRNEYNRQLEEARHKAEEANKAKSTFLFNMSHDIRTPMNAILGFTSMAKKYLYDPMHVSECLDKVELSGNHLLSLINDILDMARIENNKIVIEETPNNIRYNFEQFIEIMQPSADEKDIELSLQLNNISDEDIYVDALRLNRVIMNIMSNSLKYTKPGGSITVTVEQKPSDRPGFGAYDLIFSDTGIGMSKKFIETIFDSFTREKTSTVSGIQGTGLGMAITKNFVELMGGTIEIDSALGLGTTVTCHMYFRLQQSQDIVIEEDETDDDIDFSELRVLLVEDNELNREIARDILEELGITVEEANDGSVAVDMVCMKPVNYYDIVFMDIQMPYMDGYKACQAIRSTKNREIASVPIIAMTANAFEEDKRKALDAGMDGHLAKPLNVPEIIRTIKRFIRKK
ncbi:MAG: hybrid sensor histidine kinase/response regulator, partial [Porcipelethomonas sp.]